jgi:hypothetical protein
MTAAEIVAELGRTYKNRSAIDDLQLLTCMYLCELIPIVCDTKEYKRHELYHSRPHPVVNTPMYRLKKADEIRDDAVLMYNNGMCQRQIAKKTACIADAGVRGDRGRAGEPGVPIREYVPAGSRSVKGVVD